MCKFLLKIIKLIFGRKKLEGKSNAHKEPLTPNRYELKKILFNSIRTTDKTPSDNSINNNEFFHVEYRGKSYWVLFRCPCGCNSIISLSLQASHSPKWKLIESENGRPTLFPSIWQNKGCYSHFWITDGKVNMCFNTGVEPWKAEPLKYEAPPN